MLEKSNGTPADDMICYIERLQKEEERLVDMVADKSIRIHSLEQQVIQLHATVEDQRKMILSWQRKVAPGGDIDELRAEVERLQLIERAAKGLTFHYQVTDDEFGSRVSVQKHLWDELKAALEGKQDARS